MSRGNPLCRVRLFRWARSSSLLTSSPGAIFFPPGDWELPSVFVTSPVDEIFADLLSLLDESVALFAGQA